MSDPRVSIAMRTKDRPVLLDRAIRSVLAQTYSDWHIALVDDGGTPGSVDEVLGRYADEMAGRVTVLRNERPVGMGQTMIQSAEHGNLPLIAVHDDDDTWEPEFLERTVAALDGAAADVAGVACHTINVSERIAESGIEEIERTEHTPGMSYVSLSETIARNPFPPIAFLMRRSAYDDVGGFSRTLDRCNDWDLLLRLMMRYRVEVVPEPLANYHHRVDGGGDDAYVNSVASDSELEAARRQLVDNALREAIAAGRIDYGQLLAQTTQIDREVLTHAVLACDRTREVQLAVGDVDDRLRRTYELLRQMEPKVDRIHYWVERVARVSRLVRGKRADGEKRADPTKPSS